MTRTIRKKHNPFLKECKKVRKMQRKSARLKIKTSDPEDITDRDANIRTQGWETN